MIMTVSIIWLGHRKVPWGLQILNPLFSLCLLSRFSHIFWSSAGLAGGEGGGGGALSFAGVWGCFCLGVVICNSCSQHTSRYAFWMQYFVVWETWISIQRMTLFFFYAGILWSSIFVALNISLERPIVLNSNKLIWCKYVLHILHGAA